MFINYFSLKTIPVGITLTKPEYVHYYKINRCVSIIHDVDI